ncbi:hypothetical protein D3C78_891480 [compost metagenome]
MADLEANPVGQAEGSEGLVGLLAGAAAGRKVDQRQILDLLEMQTLTARQRVAGGEDRDQLLFGQQAFLDTLQ